MRISDLFEHIMVYDDPDDAPKDEPHLIDDGEPIFVDPLHGIHADVDYDPGGNFLRINTFTSERSGQGNAQQALQWLRDNFRHIVVHDIGYEEDEPSWRFWVKMAQRGLVDVLYAADENERDESIVYKDGRYVWPKGQQVPRSDNP